MLKPVKFQTKEKPKKYGSPSYLRRQERRKAARKSAAEASQSPESAAKVQEKETNANTEKVTVEEVQTCFRCETCSFRSETLEMREEENTYNLLNKY